MPHQFLFDTNVDVNGNHQHKEYVCKKNCAPFLPQAVAYWV